MTRAAQLLAALSLAVATALVGPGSLPGPAAHAASTCDGVWVVVEHPDRAPSQRCATGRPEDGLDALERAGHTYTFVPRQAGLVCTIDGRPDPCNGAPSDAYWAYYHADAGATSWTYSTRGAGSRSPAVGSAEAWVYGAGRRPSKPPPAPAPAPSPEPTSEPPASEASDGGSGGGTASEPSATTGPSGGTARSGSGDADGGRVETAAPSGGSGRSTADGRDGASAGAGDGSGDGAEDDRRSGRLARDDAQRDAADDPDAGDDPDAEDDDAGADDDGRARLTERTDETRASEPLDGTVQLERPGGAGRAAGTAVAGTLVAGLGVAGALRLRRRRLTDGPDPGGIGG